MARRPPKEVTAEREVRAWELRQRLWTEEMIAAEIGISQQSVSTMLRRIERRLLNQLSESVAETKARQTAQLERVAIEAMEAWERSKLNAESTETTEEDVAMDGRSTGAVQTKVKRTSKGQSGDPRHLDNVMKAMEDIRDIWGAEAPKKADVTSGGRPMGLLSSAVIVGSHERSDEASPDPDPSAA